MTEQRPQEPIVTMSEGATSTEAPSSTGCGRGCGLYLIVALVISIAVGVVTWLTEEDVDTIPLRGEVVVSAAASRSNLEPGCNAAGRILLVNASGKPVQVDLGIGERTANGSCTFTISADVPDVNIYSFSITSTRLPERTVRQSMVDTWGADGELELQGHLSW